MNTQNLDVANFPEYEAVREKVDLLILLEAGLADEIRDAEETLKASRSRSSVERQAESMLASDKLAFEADPTVNLHALRHEFEVTKKARQLAQKELNRVANECGMRVVQGLVPEYRQLVERLGRQLIELSKVAEEERAFVAELEARGLPFVGVLQPKPYLRLGRLDDPTSWLRSYLKDLREHHGIDLLPGNGSSRK